MGHVHTDEPPRSRRERRKLEVRTRILDAAIALFDERGPRQATVAEISERADVAPKTFFNHFPTKQHVMREIAEQAMEQLLVDIEEVRKRPGTTRERIERFFTLLSHNALAAGPMHRELLTEIIHAAHGSGNEAQQARRLHEAFQGLLREGAARDLTEAHDLETLTEMVQGAFYVLMFNWANSEGYPLRRRAMQAARFLGEALTNREENRGA
jgi:AcrR family transcriptional regulator